MANVLLPAGMRIETEPTIMGGRPTEDEFMSFELSSEAFRQDLPQLRRDIPGAWVAYLAGERIAHGDDPRKLVADIYRKLGHQSALFVRQVSEPAGITSH